MDHIENNICPSINNQQLAAHREKKLAFARELQRRHFGLDPGDNDDDKMSVVTDSTWVDTKAPANFSKYLSNAGSVAGSMAGASTSALRPTPESTTRPNPVLFRARDAEFPKLSAQTGNANPASKNTQWGNKQLFPDAPPAVRPTPQQLEAIQQATRKAPEWHEFDPRNPRFKAAAYYSQFTRKYKCPHRNCFKSFDSPGALSGHLSSPAHREYLKVQCPTCLRWFEGMTALTQHSESQALRCNVRDTEEYRQFLDQMTAGVLDTTDLHDDGTNKYTVPAEAVKMFGGQKEHVQRVVQEQLKKEVEKKKTYWENRDVKW